MSFNQYVYILKRCTHDDIVELVNQTANGCVTNSALYTGVNHDIIVHELDAIHRCDASEQLMQIATLVELPYKEFCEERLKQIYGIPDDAWLQKIGYRNGFYRRAYVKNDKEWTVELSPETYEGDFCDTHAKSFYAFNITEVHRWQNAYDINTYVSAHHDLDPHNYYIPLSDDDLREMHHIDSQFRPPLRMQDESICYLLSE